MTLTVLGVPRPKGNSRQVWRVKGKRRVVLAPSKQFLAWQKDATLQLRPQFLAKCRDEECAPGERWVWVLGQPIEDPVTIVATFYRDARADLDNLQKALGDVLQHAGVLKNDRQIRGWVSILRKPDSRGPLVEVEIAKEAA